MLILSVTLWYVLLGVYGERGYTELKTFEHHKSSSVMHKLAASLMVVPGHDMKDMGPTTEWR